MQKTKNKTQIDGLRKKEALTMKLTINTTFLENTFDNMS